jgi:endonuclease/exonuclease/phosphatase family metal-dependent hydrolase
MAAAAGGAKIRVVSYNIRKALGTDRKRKPNRVLDAIAGLSPDVVLLQEADLRLFGRPTVLPRDVIEARTGLVPVMVARGNRSLGWHGNAILVQPQTVHGPVVQIELPGLEPRGAVIADLEFRSTRLRVVAAHLGLLRRSRRSQLDTLNAQIGGLAHVPTVIGGDFNEWSEHEGLGRLARHFRIVSPGKTFHVRRPVAALDRFALSDELRQLASGVEINDLTRRASDHFPIWIDVALVAG